MSSRLLWKFLAINALVLGLALGIVAVSIHVLAADYFTSLVEQYNIAPAKAHEMFLTAVHRYLAGASLVSVTLAVGLSFWLTRRVLRPLTQMTRSAAKIAYGDYSMQVQPSTADEVGELAAAFNRMTQSLRRVEQLRREMVVNVAHELRTPLTNIRGYMEGLLDNVVEPSSPLFESLHEETLRLVQLVEGLLQLARADAAATTLRREPAMLNDLVLQTLELFRLRFQEKGIELSALLEEARIEVSVDRHKLAQVFTNLFENACRYTPAGGRVVVRAQRQLNDVRILVINSSSLHSQDLDCSLIFERFYRGEKSRSREYGGAGIGLAIVKELVLAHGGSVGCEWVQGEVQFWVLLPVGP